MSQDQGGEARRDAIVGFVRDFQAAHGYAPSYRQIGAGVGITAPSTVQAHVHRLVAQGRLQMEPGHPRSVVATEAESLPKQLEAAAQEVRWLSSNSDGVTGLRLDGGVMPWPEVLDLYAPTLRALVLVTDSPDPVGCPGHAADVDRGPHAGSRSSSRGSGATPTAGPDSR